jgi:hypothetical protein
MSSSSFSQTYIELKVDLWAKCFFKNNLKIIFKKNKKKYIYIYWNNGVQVSFQKLKLSLFIFKFQSLEI